MQKHIKKIRKKKISKGEIIADLIFLAIPAIITAIVVFLFDIHHSFYNWPMELKFIFKTAYPYLIFIPIGAIVGFFLLKLIAFGFKEETK